jgi:hypothetical protein
VRNSARWCAYFVRFTGMQPGCHAQQGKNTLNRRTQGTFQGEVPQRCYVWRQMPQANWSVSVGSRTESIKRKALKIEHNPMRGVSW